MAVARQVYASGLCGKMFSRIKIPALTDLIASV